MSKNYKTSSRPDQKECELGWNCEKVLQNKCKLQHNPNDKEDILALNRIKKDKIIIIVDTYCKENRPACLLEIQLPIKLIPNQKANIELGKYYHGKYVGIENRRALIEVEKCIGKFGDWKIERVIYQNHFPDLFDQCHRPQNIKEKRGKIKVNGALRKVLQGQQGLRQNLQFVNRKYKHPLMDGCEVSYIEKQDKILISKIRYPQYQKFSGILQIDAKSQFYFISRSETHDDMTPYRIPEDLIFQVKEHINSIPYTIFKKDKLKNQTKDKINRMLKNYLVKGEFEEWPLQSQYPIIFIENEVEQRTFQAEKQGIIYETGIGLRSFSKNEKKQSEKLSKKIKIEDYKNRTRFDGKIYTVDNKNTKCYDDAFYISQIKEGGFEVEIHIADVAQIVKSSSSLDRSIKDRDSTLYIRDYFQPMIDESLRNKLSLKSGERKLALTLRFTVSKQGRIDFSTVRFIKSIISVDQNLTHEKLEKGIDKYQELFQVSECLGKGELMIESLLIQYGLKSQLCTSRLIQLSSLIPTVMLEINVKRSRQFKTKFEEYVKKLIEEKQKEMQLWENEVQKIDAVVKQLRISQKKDKEIKLRITREIEKEKNKLTKQIKQEIKAKSQEAKKQKNVKVKKINAEGQKQTESETETQQDLEQQQEQANIANLPSQINQFEENEQVEITAQRQILMKQIRAKALKQMKNKQNFVESSFSEQSSSQDQSQIQVSLTDGYKITKAMGGKKYMNKIFQHFGITLEWLKQSQINDAFRQILSLDKGRLYQDYFKRMQIMNRQHFPYIIEMAKKQKKQAQQGNQTKNQNNRDQPQYRRPRNKFNRQNLIQQKKIQEKEQNEGYTTKQNSNQRPEKKPQQEYAKTNQQKIKTENALGAQNNAQKTQNKQGSRTVRKQQGVFSEKESIGNQEYNKNSKRLGPSQGENFQISEIPINQSKPTVISSKMGPINLSYGPSMLKGEFNPPPSMSNTQYPPIMMDQFKKKSQQQNDQKPHPIQPHIRYNQYSKFIKQKTQIKPHKQQLKEDGKVLGQSKGEKESQCLKSNKPLHKLNIPSKISRIQKRYMNQKHKQFSLAETDKFRELMSSLQSKTQELEQYFKTIEENNQLSKIKYTQQEESMLKQNSKDFDDAYRRLKKQTIYDLYLLSKKSSRAKNIKQVHIPLKSQESNVQKTQQVKESKNQVVSNQEEKDHQQKYDSKKIENQNKESIETNEPKNQIPEKLQQIKMVDTEPKKPKKLTKRQINKMVLQQLKPISEEIKSKYKEELEKLSEQIQKLKQQQTDAAKLLKLQLEKSKIHFNLIRLMALDSKKNLDQSNQQSQNQQESGDQGKKRRKKTKPNKKKNNKKQNKKKSKKNVFEQILQSFESYADKSNYDFEIMQDQQLDGFLKKQLNFKYMSEDDSYSIQKLNQQAIKIAAEKFMLKWNNPIRSYQSLMAMRLIKDYDWLFQGNVFPTQIIKFSDQLKQIQKKLKKMKEYQQEKIANGQNDKKVREANRQIDYLQLYYKLKKNPDQVFTFLNITSPTPRIKRVYHEILGDVDIEDIKVVQKLYKQVKGRVKIVRDYPIKLKIEIIS